MPCWRQASEPTRSDLDFAASPRRIEIETAGEIVRRLPPDVMAVGVFRNQERTEVVETAEAAGIGVVQLHGDESPEDCRWVADRVQGVIRAFGIADPGLTSGADYGPHRLLIDSPAPGSGQVFDWSNLELVLGGRPFILADGLTPDNVADAIEVARPWGVDVASGVETTPGHKDPTRLRRFIANARRAAATLLRTSAPGGRLFGSTSRATTNTTRRQHGRSGGFDGFGLARRRRRRKR